MKKYKKMIAPIIITLFLCTYMGLVGGIIIMDTVVGGGLFYGFLFGLMPLVFIGCMLWVLYKRYKEIKGGYEDDLSNY